MTAQQEKRVQQIREYVEKTDVHSETYEIKQFEVVENGPDSVEVYSVTGLIGDEGTMAEAFCRAHRQIFIGARGGLTTYKHNPKTRKDSTLYGWSQVMIFGARY